MWVLVLLAFLSTLHLRTVLRKVPDRPHRERLAQPMHAFRRISRITRWAGHALLMIGAGVAILGWLVGGLFGGVLDLRTGTTTILS